MNTPKQKPNKSRNIIEGSLGVVKIHGRVRIVRNPDPRLREWKLCCFIRDLPSVLRRAKRNKLGHVAEATESLITALSGTDQDKRIFVTLAPSLSGVALDLRIEPDPPKVPKIAWRGKGPKPNRDMARVLKQLKADK